MADTLITGSTLIETKTKLDFTATGTSGWDFQVGDLTTDGTIQSLDISGIVPSGTTWVFLRVLVSDGSTNQSMQVGDTSPLTSNAMVVVTQVANIDIEGNGFIRVPADRTIYYIGSNTTFTKINIKVTGYI